MKLEVRHFLENELEELGVNKWPIWEKEESVFEWSYSDKETCYFLEGEAEIKLPDGSIIKIIKGCLVVFPKGLECSWAIRKKVRKHYKFG